MDAIDEAIEKCRDHYYGGTKIANEAMKEINELRSLCAEQSIELKKLRAALDKARNELELYKEMARINKFDEAQDAANEARRLFEILVTDDETDQLDQFNMQPVLDWLDAHPAPAQEENKS